MHLPLVHRAPNFRVGRALGILCMALGLLAASPASGRSGASGPNSKDAPPSRAKKDPGQRASKGPQRITEGSRRVASRSSASSPWAYVLPVDHGVRSDESGDGHFRAGRFHGEHNGIDLLAPIGTPVFSTCRGRAIAGASPSFGRWVRVVCPVPRSLVEKKRQPYASIFYAHLDSSTLPHDTWVRVNKGKILGEVGKTGNASAVSVKPHLHLELIIQSSLRAALDEHHNGRDQRMVSAAKQFMGALEARCLFPNGFRPRSGRLSRARRADPFLVLTCLTADKPTYRSAPDQLRIASTPWSELYSASGFNVNAGPRAFLLASR